MELTGEETQALEVTPSWILLWGGGVGGGVGSHAGFRLLSNSATCLLCDLEHGA